MLVPRCIRGDADHPMLGSEQDHKGWESGETGVESSINGIRGVEGSDHEMVGHRHGHGFLRDSNIQRGRRP